MKLKQSLVLAGGFVCAVSVCQANSAWQPTTGGEYSFEYTANWDVSPGNWTSQFDTRRTLTEEQIITVNEPHLEMQAFYPGGGANYPQVFRGAALGCSNLLRFMGGKVVFENEVRSSSPENYIGYVSDSTVTFRNGGSFLPDVEKTIHVGMPRTTATESGTLVVEPGGLVALTNGVLRIGNASGSNRDCGAVWVDGGRLELRGTSSAYVGSGAGGYLRVDAGELRLGNNNSFVGSAIGHYAQMHVSGGSVVRDGSNNVFQVGAPSTAGVVYADLYVDGGTLSLMNMPLFIGVFADGSSASAGGIASVTIDKGARASFQNVAVGYRNSPGATSVLNLRNGGTLGFNELQKKTGGQSRWFNFDGGVLENEIQNTWNAGTAETVIYPGGGTLLHEQQGLIVEESFRSAKGYGVASVTLTNPGANYIVPPRVVISGGSGSNATAVAILNRDRTLARIEVTCRGEGYKADDALTVSFTTQNGMGSGAAATVTLAENTLPTFTNKSLYTLTTHQRAINRFDGILSLDSGYWNLYNSATLPNLHALRIGGGLFTDRELDGVTNTVNPAAELVFANGNPTVNVSPRRDPTYRIFAAKSAGVTNRQEFATLRAADGYGLLDLLGTSNAGGAEMSFGSYVRERGLVWYTPKENFPVTIGATDNISDSTVCPVLNGFFDYANMAPLQRLADGTVAAVELTATAGADANVLAPAATTHVTATKINSLVFGNHGTSDQYYFDTDEQVEIRSGMVLGRSSSAKVSRLAVNGKGTVTTRAPGGMVLFENNLNDRVNYGGRRFLMAGPFADPAGGAPMALTVAGPRAHTPQEGALIWMLNANSFSGGLNLNNGGIVYDNDNALGASGCPIYASGNCLLYTRTGAVNMPATRTLDIAADSTLLLISATASGNTVAAKLTGRGAVFFGAPNTSRRFTVTGDHSEFAGDYYIASALTSDVLSPNACIHFANTSDFSYGMLDMKGRFTRAVGTGPGEVCWGGHRAVTADRGGWSAVGGDLVVDLGGAGAPVQMGQKGLAAGTIIRLQDEYADGSLSVVNPFDLTRGTVTFEVYPGKRASVTNLINASGSTRAVTLRGAGTLVLTGSVGEGIGFVERGSLEVAAGNSVAVNGDSAYTGTTMVPAGAALEVNGAHTGAGDYSVAGTLGGSGRIVPAANKSITFAAGARISPSGRGKVGTLAFGNAVTNTTVSLRSTTLEIDPPVDNAIDGVSVAGNLSLAGDCDVELSGDAAAWSALRANRYVIASVSGTLDGAFSKKTNLDGWRVSTTANGDIALSYSMGLMVIIQ